LVGSKNEIFDSYVKKCYPNTEYAFLCVHLELIGGNDSFIILSDYEMFIPHESIGMAKTHHFIISNDFIFGEI
jgi:hypothetical protein